MNAKTKGPEQPGTGLAVLSGDKLPDHLRDKQGQKARGNENVTSDDIVVPRIDVVQSLSPQREQGHAKFIEGATEGLLFNSVSGRLYGKVVQFIPVLFTKQYLVWKARKSGGGFRGAYGSLEEANAFIATQPEATQTIEGKPVLEAVETALHVVLIAGEGGKLETAALSMARTKLKVSKQLNTLVRLNGGDRFSRVYELSSAQEKNGQGQTYFNFSVKSLGYAPKEAYIYAERAYNELADRTIVADQTDGGDDHEGQPRSDI